MIEEKRLYIRDGSTRSYGDYPSMKDRFAASPGHKPICVEGLFHEDGELNYAYVDEARKMRATRAREAWQKNRPIHKFNLEDALIWTVKPLYFIGIAAAVIMMVTSALKPKHIPTTPRPPAAPEAPRHEWGVRPALAPFRPQKVSHDQLPSPLTVNRYDFT